MSYMLDKFAMEAIDFQKDSKLAASIENSLRQVREHKNPQNKHLRSSKLHEVVKKITGLDVTFNIDEIGLNAYVLVPTIDRNNTVINEWRRGYIRNTDSSRLLRSNDVIKGTVDFKNSRVTGDFTKIQVSIAVGKEVVMKGSKLTVRGAVTIIMHEIGHVMSYLEMLGRSLTTNYAMAETTKRLLATNVKDTKYAIMEDFEEFTGTKITDKEALQDAQSEGALNVILLSDSVTKSVSDLGTNIYDMRGFEYLADNFVARHGMAKDLAIALDVLYRNGGSSSYYSTVTHVSVEISKVLGFILLGVTVTLLAIFILCSNPLAREYDKPEKRIAVIRRETSRSLREPGLSKKDKERILSDIDEMDRVLSEMKDRVNFYEWIWGNIYPWGRRQKKSVELQQGLEAMSNNKLFESAERLRQL